ncbi:hypothetical protein D3C75_794380 [compost metagenome]
MSHIDLSPVELQIPDVVSIRCFLEWFTQGFNHSSYIRRHYSCCGSARCIGNGTFSSWLYTCRSIIFQFRAADNHSTYTCDDRQNKSCPFRTTLHILFLLHFKYLQFVMIQNVSLYIMSKYTPTQQISPVLCKKIDNHILRWVVHTSFNRSIEREQYCTNRKLLMD